MANLSPEDVAAIWDIGVFDAHCHPTDIVASIDTISNMKARVLTIMATRSQDQDLVAKAAKQHRVTEQPDLATADSRYVIPAFGWHPWFSYQMYDDRAGTATMDAVEHYKNVLTPSPDDEEFLKDLQEPRSLKEFLTQTEARLKQFPLALVGEVGLDRSFRLPYGGFVSAGDMSAKTGGSDEKYTPGSREGRPLSPHRVNLDHQKLILRAQLDLAAKHRRACSVHSVQTHGLVFDLLQEMWKGHERPSKRSQRQRKSATKAQTTTQQSLEEPDASPPPYPPRICMHSYSGPPDTIKQFVAPSVPADVYFSFSQLINFSNRSSKKIEECIRLVPDDRILIESDFHCAGDQMDELLKSIVGQVCHIKGWGIREGAARLRRNWETFVFG